MRMTDYTPTTEEVREEYVYGAQEVDLDDRVVVSFDEADARFDRWLAAHDAEVKAEAWDEGHRHRWRRDRDDGCTCAAWSSNECACGLYGTGELLSLADNPYREGRTR